MWGYLCLKLVHFVLFADDQIILFSTQSTFDEQLGVLSKLKFECSLLVAAVRRTQTDNVSINDGDIDADTVCCCDRYLYIIVNEHLC